MKLTDKIFTAVIILFILFLGFMGFSEVDETDFDCFRRTANEICAIEYDGKLESIRTEPMSFSCLSKHKEISGLYFTQEEIDSCPDIKKGWF